MIWTLYFLILEYLRVMLNILQFVLLLNYEDFKEQTETISCHHFHVKVKQIAVYQHIFGWLQNGIYISVSYSTLNDTTDGMAHFKCPDTDQSIVHLIDSHINLHTDQVCSVALFGNF